MASGNFVISATFAGSVTQTNGYWSSTPNYSNNTSTISVEFYVTKASGFSTTFGNGTWGINVDGTNYPVDRNISVPANSTVFVHSVSGIVINHNANGTRSVGISVSGSIPATTWTSTTGSTTADLEDLIPDPVWQTGTTLSAATRGSAVSRTVTATSATGYSLLSSSGGTGTYSINNSGVITGTPSATGTASLNVRASNGSGTTDRTFTMVVNPALPVFSDSTVATATRNTAYSDGFTASETASYALRNLADNANVSAPPGLSFNTTTGALTGTPTTVGNTEFRVRATNVTGSTTTGTITFTVNPALPVFSDSTVNSSSRAGVAYSDGVSASEVPSNGYSVRNSENTGVGTLPPGLNLNASTGAITGTPTTPGTYQFRIRATNVTGSADTSVLTITIFGGSKMWNGTSFANLIPRIWNGTSYVESVPRIWNGSAWIRI
jgi:hypothetical protein